MTKDEIRIYFQGANNYYTEVNGTTNGYYETIETIVDGYKDDLKEFSGNEMYDLFPDQVKLYSIILSCDISEFDGLKTRDELIKKIDEIKNRKNEKLE